MNLVLVFGGDWVNIWQDYAGALIYQNSMVVPLKKVTNELQEKVNLFNDTHEENISQGELIQYCIDNKLVTHENAEQKLREFYCLG